MRWSLGLQDAGERVVPVRYLGATAWLILRHEDVGRAFRDNIRFPASAANLRYSLPVQGKTLLCMDGEEHRIHRALVAEAFQPKAVQAHVASLLRPLANELIDAFGARRELDLVAAYCHRYPAAGDHAPARHPGSRRGAAVRLGARPVRLPVQPCRCAQGA